MRSLTFYALAFPLLVAADSEWGVPAGGYGQYMKDVNWNTVSYGNGFGGNQPPPTDTPVVQEKAAEQVAVPPSSTGGAASQASPVSSASGSQNTGSSSSQGTAATSNGGPSNSGSCSSQQQAIELVNNSGKDMQINGAGPWNAKTADFDCSTIKAGDSCTVCQERNSDGGPGGALQLGYGSLPNAPNSARVTLIEGNWDLNAAPCVDISYIPGYTVPVVCTASDGTSTVGSSEPLCADEACSNCPDDAGGYIGGSCLNPTGSAFANPDTHAPPFFSGSGSIENFVYTFPNDDKTTANDNPNNHVVAFTQAWSSMKCVLHPQSKAGASKEKREAQPQALEEVLAQPEKREIKSAREHSHIRRRHSGMKRHSHGHAAIVDESI